MMTGAMRASLKGFLPFFVFGAVGIGLGAWSVVGMRSDKEVIACDQAVHQLMTTKDKVELRRSIFLIRWLNCSVSRRLP